MAKKKYYVVWKGHKTGVFDNWDECKKAVEGYDKAWYQGFESRAQAEYAFKHPGAAKSKSKGAKAGEQNIIWNSLSVDAACSGNPGEMEYQGVHTETKKVIFREKHPLGTNNIGEFLAIVHGISYLKKHGLKLPIYTDSMTALSWVKNKKVKTKLKETKETAELFKIVRRAENWLKTNTYDIPLLKWDTKKWGEIPADFGRK